MTETFATPCAAPRWVTVPELRRMLEHEPERFFPPHLGALSNYLEEHL